MTRTGLDLDDPELILRLPHHVYSLAGDCLDLPNLTRSRILGYWSPFTYMHIVGKTGEQEAVFRQEPLPDRDLERHKMRIGRLRAHNLKVSSRPLTNLATMIYTIYCPAGGGLTLTI